jgi:hypothetical protein
LYNKHVGNSLRIVNWNDPVPFVPPNLLMFRHVHEANYFLGNMLIESSQGEDFKSMVKRNTVRFSSMILRTMMSVFVNFFNPASTHSMNLYIDRIKKSIGE